MLDDTNFEYVPHATLKEALIGLFLMLGVAVGGETSKLDLKVTDKPPFLKAKVNGVSTKQLEEAFENFLKFAVDIEEVIVFKLPEMISTIAQLA